MMSLSTFEALLSEDNFFECHRSQIINLCHLKKFVKFDRVIILNDNHVVVIAEDRVCFRERKTSKGDPTWSSPLIVPFDRPLWSSPVIVPFDRPIKNNYMTNYNKDHGRKNMRLHRYDYSHCGLYFLTLVVQNRLHLFGHVQNREMILNNAGCMVKKWYHEIEHKFPDKRCHELVVMANHFHCIIENLEIVGVAPRGHQISSDAHVSLSDAHAGAPLRGCPDNINHSGNDIRPENNEHIITNEKYGIHNIVYGATIGDVMDWFKTMTTNEYIRGVKNNNWQRYDGKLWQRNYYDHIIRNDNSYQKITDYIVNNPANWRDDKFYGE